MICTEQDEWLKEKLVFEPRWVAELSDGTAAFMDDGRHLAEPPSAWLRLKEYCYAEGIDIVKMRFQWRQLTFELEPNADAYFFCKEIFGMWGSTENLHYYWGGWVKNGILTKVKYEVPSLINVKTEEQDVVESDYDNDCLIWSTLCLKNKNTNLVLVENGN